MKTTKRAADKPLETVTLGQLLAHPFPPREHLMAPWLRQGESAMLWAPAGLGKTMLALTLALAVAGGGTVLGWTAPRPRKVLLVDGEMHAQDLRDRLAILAPSISGFDPERAAGNLSIISRQHQGAGVYFPDLAQAHPGADGRPAGQEVILGAARVAEADLVILDNLATLAELSDENEAAAMSPVLHFLLRLKQENRACLLVHHSGKSGEDYRGSSKLATTFEVIIGLHKLDGRSTKDGTGFELRWGKFRGTPSAATRDMEVLLGEVDGDLDGSKWAQWTHSPAASAEVWTLVEEVRRCAHGTQRDVAAALGWDQAKVTRLKARAIREGITTKAEWDECLAGGQTEF